MHTSYSDGKQDIEEAVKGAKEKGLKEVAITEHGPAVMVIGVEEEEVYYQIKDQIARINESGDEVKVYLGAEANICGMNGELDLSPHLREELDVLIAGLHPYTYPSSLKDGWELQGKNMLRHLGKGFRARAINNNTKACVEALYNHPGLDILAHPGLFFEVDYEEVARACSKTGTLFEINCGHKHPPLSDIIKVNKVGACFIINSDAHFKDTVGDLAYGAYVVEKAGLAPNAVANLDEGGGISWIKKKRCIYL
ncbi:putative hydrolase [Thermosyntropha lipolytica DSM 11003]|uniref:Putative hydrolase n=1 Tax=Thermosyntropha lipolytica DSM 11003 TaxID=1123382 RepID=A0A1M5KL60_9FIRM|nr:putative hydrolase [Thermosyntropha lipolytica DSM 11003]